MKLPLKDNWVADTAQRKDETFVEFVRTPDTSVQTGYLKDDMIYHVNYSQVEDDVEGHVYKSDRVICSLSDVARIISFVPAN